DPITPSPPSLTSHPLTYLMPRKLLAVLESHETNIDFRHVNPNDSDAGYYWRMPVDDDVLNAHLQAYRLQPVATNHYDYQRTVQKMFEKFPADWPDLTTRSLNSHAYM